MHNKGRFMEDLDASIEAFMAKGYDRKQAIALYFESTKDKPDDDDQYSGESVQNRRDDSASSVRSSDYDDQRRRYRAARETFHKVMTTNSKTSMKTNDSNKHNNDGRAYYDEYNLYESRDIEEFTSSDLKTLIEPNPLQAEKQFSSIANLDYHNNSRISAAFNGTDSIYANKSHSEKKATTGRNSLNLSASQPQSKSTNNSSNLSSPFANMPKFKVTISDDEGSDSEYGGEIKYYDLNRWNRKDNRGDGADLDGLQMNGDGEYSNLRRVGSLTELLALKDKGKPAALTEMQKPQASRQQQQQQQQQQQLRPQQDLRDQAVHLLHSESSDYEQDIQQKSGPSVPSDVDEREIQWLMSIGYTREQAVLMDRTRMGSGNPSMSREANGEGRMDHHADYAMQQAAHRQLQQQGRNGNSTSGRESSRQYFEATANTSLKGGGSSLPSDTADRIRHGYVSADTSFSATKRAASVSTQFEIENELAQLMKKGYTREQAYQVVQQATAQQQQKQQQQQQQQQQQLLQQRQIHEQLSSASDYGSAEPFHHSASVNNRYSQKMHASSSAVGQDNDVVSVHTRYSQKIQSSSSVVGQDNDTISVHLGSLMSKGYTLEQAQQLLAHSSASPQQSNRQETIYSDHNNHHSLAQQQQRKSSSSRYSLPGSNQGSPPQYIDHRKQQHFVGDDGASVVSSRDYYGNNYIPQPPQLSSPSRSTVQTNVRKSEGSDHNSFGSRYMKSVQSLGENEAMKVALLLSEQEASYGTNMYESLTERDGVDIERQVGAGVSTEEAILSIFRQKIASIPVSDTSRSATASMSVSSSSAPSPQRTSQHIGRDTLDRGSASPIDNDLASVGGNATGRSASTRPESLRQPSASSGDRPESRNSKKNFFGFSSYFPFSSKSRSPENNHSPSVELDDHSESVNTKRHASSSPDLTGSNSFNDNDVATLMALGFTRAQSIDALHSNNGDVRRAALHLLSRS